MLATVIHWFVCNILVETQLWFEVLIDCFFMQNISIVVENEIPYGFPVHLIVN